MARVADELNNPDFDPVIFNLFLVSVLVGYNLLRTVLLPDWQTDDESNLEKIVDAL